ncbi:hypothetical protein [Brevundimonas vesicularis]|uniref:hypothetical protein n=1 Tax=Brevundimonas vesicularis TaxID=41276 RepID=UPI00215D3D40|nr:hypothetical protein [Brevundimonas vesicularis]
MRRLDRRGAIRFVDVSDGQTLCPLDREAFLARFHATENGRLLSGAAAFDVAGHPAAASAGPGRTHPLGPCGVGESVPGVSAPASSTSVSRSQMGPVMGIKHVRA